ncbi:MAG TPA: hypothetical protein VNC22_23260 [Sporichthya sp.]|jgi:hypothetical protein|nr:hypothetical protein [Sporichthya sp.]
MDYTVTHHSIRDGSPAMLVRRLNDTEGLFVNEDGDEWTDELVYWHPVVTQRDT